MQALDETGDWRARLQAEIERKGTSRRAVSIAAKMGPGAISSWMNEGKDPTVDNLMRVCKVLGVSLAYIMYGYRVSPETEDILRRLEDNPEMRDGILAILRQKAV